MKWHLATLSQLLTTWAVPLLLFCEHAEGEQLLHKLYAADAASGDRFGVSVATDGNFALVGADSNLDGLGDFRGSAYLFDVTTGEQLWRVDGRAWGFANLHGFSVALDGDLALVGAPGEDSFNHGAVYVYRTSNGEQLQRLFPPALTSDGYANDLLGHSVDLLGTKALLGAPSTNAATYGSAFLFDALTGQELAHLRANDRRARDEFGEAVALSETYAVIGATGSLSNGIATGAAYVFDVNTGVQLFKLTPNDGLQGDRFGNSVAVDGNYALIGNANRLNSRNGAAYLYDITTGQQLMKILPSPESADVSGAFTFGFDVALEDGLAIVSATGDRHEGRNSGAVYWFELPTGKLIGKVGPAEGAPFDYFGISLAYSDGVLLAGAFKDDDFGNESGSAYLYRIIVPEPDSATMFSVLLAVAAVSRGRVPRGDRVLDYSEQAAGPSG